MCPTQQTRITRFPTISTIRAARRSRRQPRRRQRLKTGAGVEPITWMANPHARLPLIPRELEWPRADDLFELLLGRRGGDPRRHHKGHIARWLSQCVEHGTEALGEFE